MAKKTKLPPNRNYHARLVFKSGVIQDLSVVAASTDVFEGMIAAYRTHLTGSGPPGGIYHVNNGFGVRWTEVDSFHTWID